MVGFIYFITATDVLAHFPIPDSSITQTPLLIKASLIDGAKNNTFIDSSSSNVSITTFGSPTIGSFTPYDNGWSTYFNGSSFLTSANDATHLSLSGDFTIELWVYLTNYAHYAFIAANNGSYQGVSFGLDETGHFILDNGVTGNPASVAICPLYKWTHLAVSRLSGTSTVYVNGTSVLTNQFVPSPTDRISIGTYNNGSFNFVGYISNLRIVNGTALYTSTFTPSSTPLTAITNTVLLACQSNRHKDNSTNNYTLTGTGSPAIKTFNSFNPISPGYTTTTNGGSMYFNGTTDYLSGGSNNLFAFGMGDFTIEYWVYYTNFVNYITTISTRTGTNTTSWSIGTQAAGQIVFYAGSELLRGTTGSAINGQLNLNAWNHVAITRQGNTLRGFCNGYLFQTTTNSYNFTANTLYIGKDVTYAEYTPGYITDVRIVNGTAVYTTNFTPPSTPLTSLTNTVMLLNGTNANIYDATANTDIVTNGGCVVSTTTKKYSQSVHFDGVTGSYLTIPYSPVLDFKSGDFTIEFWINITNGSPLQMIYGSRANASSYCPILFALQSSTILLYLSNSNGGWNVAGAVLTGILSNNTWYHFAYVRSGTSFKSYVNGVQVSANTYTYVLPNSPTDTHIGGETNGYSFTGYIEDFRITTGIARYTANFTPPTQQLSSF